MATVTRAESSGDPTTGEPRILTAGVSWDFYTRFVEGLPAWSRVRAAFGVPEVWRFDGSALQINRLTPVGLYEAVPASGWLPVDAADILAWITSANASDRPAWVRRLRAWLTR